MQENAKPRNSKLERIRKRIHPAGVEQNAEEVEHRARLMEIAQKYTLHLRVVDPEGREILNVTKLTLGRNLHEEGDTIPALQDVLELLIEAAEEHLLPSD
jgi:hypothetical protein